MTIRRYADLAAHVIEAPPRLGRARYVAVDGPAGAGKTTFAGRLAVALRAAGASVEELHTDDLLDGWTDTVSFWPRLDAVLTDLRAGRTGRYQRYDWSAGRFGDTWQPVPVPDVLLVEGVSSARAATLAYLGLSVFVVADPAVRLARGLARDGEALRGEWERWMVAEREHFTADGTADRADVLVDGAPTVAHDGAREYVEAPRPD